MSDTIALSVLNLAKLCEGLGLKFCCAESCTGGWIAKACTDLAGSSTWFDCGFVTYSNEAKQEMLGIDASLLVEHGAVSEAVVKAMSAGALNKSNADIAVAVSGIAGPGGGTPAKPVGTVWIAWKRADEEAVAKQFLFRGDRNRIRVQAVEAALKGVTELV